MPNRFTPLALAILAASAARADVTLPSILSDHMVLQRLQPIHVWGRAVAGESISASFRRETRAATADDLGFWSLYFTPSKAGGPFELTIKANNAITLRDIMVG